MTRAWPHAVAAAVVVVGLAAQIIRPTAPDVGPALAASAFFDDAFLQRAAAYRRPLELVALAALVIRLAVAILVGFTPAGRRLTNGLLFRLGGLVERRPSLAAAVVIVGTVIATDLLILPLAFWAGYVHDGTFGLRTQDAAGWFFDWAAVQGPVWVGVAVAAGGGYAIARRAPRTWPVIAGVSAGLLGAFVVFAGPLVLEPLQFRLRPLEPGPVRTEVERVLAEADLDGLQILVADASRRSTRQNAYVSGLGATRRIVLYDTLVDQRPPAEVGTILAHELGHRQHGDLWRGALFGAAGLIVAAYLLDRLARRRLRVGRQRELADPAAAGAVFAAVTVLVVLSLPLQHAVSRRAESAADAASLRLTQAPETMLRMQQGLAIANLSDPDPPRWVQLLWGSHPPAVERLTRARRWAGS